MSEDYKNMDYYELYEYIEKLRKQLDDAIRVLGIYADDRHWHSTPTFTEWTLNPHGSLFAKRILEKINRTGGA